MTNNQETQLDIPDQFNNIESVESIYPADSIDIIDTISSALVSSDTDAAEPNQSAANDQLASGHIYSLSNARLVKLSRSQERRAFKSRLTDRRSDVRMEANGEPQPDRRAANRLANVEAIRSSNRDN